MTLEFCERVGSWREGKARQVREYDECSRKGLEPSDVCEQRWKVNLEKVRASVRVDSLSWAQGGAWLQEARVC